MDTASAGAPRSVRVLELGEDGAPVHQGLLVIEVGTRLVFSVRPNPRIDLSTLCIWTNCPLAPSDPFARHTYTCVEGSDEDTVNGDWQGFVDVSVPGAFELFAEFSRYADGTLISAPPVVPEAGSTPVLSPTSGKPHVGYRRRSGAGPLFVVPPPAANRRGGMVRFVVQPELTVTLLRPLTPAEAAAAVRGRKGARWAKAVGGSGVALVSLVGSPEDGQAQRAPSGSGDDDTDSESDEDSEEDESFSSRSSEDTSGGDVLMMEGDLGTAMGHDHRSRGEDATRASGGSDGFGEDESEATKTPRFDLSAAAAAAAAGAGGGVLASGAAPVAAGPAPPAQGARRLCAAPHTTGTTADGTPVGLGGLSGSGLVPRTDSSTAALLPGLALPGIYLSAGGYKMSSGQRLPRYEAVTLPLPLEGITLQTQLTRCLGPIDGWLRYAPDPAGGMGGSGLSASPSVPVSVGATAPTGGSSSSSSSLPPLMLVGTLAEPLALRYNMLHFTPVQRLGGSHSAYSLSDQLCLEWEAFAGNGAVNGAVAKAKAGMAGWLEPLLSMSAQVTARAQLRSARSRTGSTTTSPAAQPALPGGGALSTPSKVAASGAPASLIGSQFDVTNLSTPGSSASHSGHASNSSSGGQLATGLPQHVISPSTAKVAAALAQATAEDASLLSSGTPSSAATGASSASSAVAVAAAERSLAEAKVWTHPLVEGAKMAVLRRMVTHLERHHGVLSMVDVVLNHTSTDSPWLRAHPEAAYSLRNSPHLRAAFELDEAVLRVSDAVTRGNVPGVTPDMRDAGAVAAVVDVLRHHSSLGLPATRLWEFYAVDTAGTVGAAAALTPGVDVTDEAEAAVADSDNVQGGDVSAHPPPAALFSKGVPPQTLSAERRFEIAACRTRAVADILAAFKSGGFDRGNGAPHVHAGDLERLAGALSAQPPPPPVEDAATRLRHPYKPTVAAPFGSPVYRSPSDAAVRFSGDATEVLGGDTPQATPVPHGHGAAPSEPVATGAFPYGRPSVGPTSTNVRHISVTDADVADLTGLALSVTPSGPGPERSPSPQPFRPRPDGGDAPAQLLQGNGSSRGTPSSAHGGAHEAWHPFASLRSWLRVVRRGAVGLAHLAHLDGNTSVRTSNGSGDSHAPPPPIGLPPRLPLSSSSSSGSEDGATGPDAPATFAQSARFAASPYVRSVNRSVHGDAESATPAPGRPADLASLSGGAFNDGSGGRFPVHIDLAKAIAALNTLPGVAIDPDAWVWPPLQGDVNLTCAEGANGKLGLLPSLYLIQRLVDTVNLGLYRRYDEDIGAALGAVAGTAAYQWLDVWHGKERLAPQRPLVFSYFTRVLQEDGQALPQKPETFLTPSKRVPSLPLQSAASPPPVHVLACNGFIWNGDPEIDFTLPLDAARTYAALVRAGTAEPQYVKRRPLDGSAATTPSAAGRRGGGAAGASGDGDGSDSESEGGSTPDVTRVDGAPDLDVPRTGGSKQQEGGGKRGPASAPESFLGESLLCMPPRVLSALRAAWDAGDWATVERVTTSAAEAEAARASGLGRQRPTASASAESFPTTRIDYDGVPHLRPDVIPPPLVASSTPYMRREIVIWGDCVKLRYGLTPSDSPWLWAHMETYIRRMASVFQALRVDNAHGTPLHVAAAMIDAARNVRPQLYVNAELFTGSLDRDVEYVSRLGINSLVREAMQAGSPGELARGVYSYGGSPIASLRPPFRGGSVAARVEALLAGHGKTGGRHHDHHHVGGDADESDGHPGMPRRRLLLGSALSMGSLGGPQSPGESHDFPSSSGGGGNGNYSSSGGGVGGLASSPSLQDMVYAAASATRRAGTYASINGFPLTALALASQIQAKLAQQERALRAANGKGGGQGLPTVLSPDGTAAGASDPYSTAHPGAAAAAAAARGNETTVAEVLPSPLPALFFDCTHDNPTANEKRHPADALSAAVIVSAAVCAGGTTRGTDILVPENLSVVTDHRLYGPGTSVSFAAVNKLDGAPAPPTAPCVLVPGQRPTTASAPASGGASSGAGSASSASAGLFGGFPGGGGVRLGVELQSGMRLVRRSLNHLKQEMAAKGHSEVFVSVDGAPCGADVVTVVRGHPSAPSCYVFITRTAFSRQSGDARGNHGGLPEIRVEGKVTAVVMAASLAVPNQEVRTRPPKGKRLLFPSVLDPDHPANAGGSSTPAGARGRPRKLGPWAEDPLSAAHARFNHANTEGIAGYAEPGGRWWDADQDVINGLACSLDYSDEAMVEAAEAAAVAGSGGAGGGPSTSHPPGPQRWNACTLGLATFSESPFAPTGGGVMTTVRLDADRFGPGSVLVFKVRAPRNVALRASPIVPPSALLQHIPNVDTATGALATAMFLSPPRGRSGSAGGVGEGGVGLAYLTSAGSSVGLSMESPSPQHHVLGLVGFGSASGGVGASVNGGALTPHLSSTGSMQLLPRTASRRRLTPSASSLALHGPLAAGHHPFAGAASPLRTARSGDPGLGSRSGSANSLSGMVVLHGPTGPGASASSEGHGGDMVTPPRPRARMRLFRVPSAARGSSVFFGPPVSELLEALSSPDVTLASLNRLLYRCDPEERDDSWGARGVYGVPGLPLSATPWAGIAGVAHRLRSSRKWNSMGDPLLDNVRAGHWFLDYHAGRLAGSPELDGVKRWLEAHFAILKALPPGLRPQGFDRVMTAAFNAAVGAAVARFGGPLFPASGGPHSTASTHFSMLAAGQHYLVGVPHVPDDSDVDDVEAGAGFAAADTLAAPGGFGSGDAPPLVQEGHTDPSAALPFLTALALTSVQLWGETRSSPLMALPLMEADAPSSRAPGAASGTPAICDNDGSAPPRLAPALGSLAAGVDHFATGYMRVWGRDTFISLRGLLLATGRYRDARTTILAFACVTRHGLLPNLMDGGRNPRFNCRDAAWWFLQAVVDYCTMAPEGARILSARVHRRFPSDAQADYRIEDGYPVYADSGTAPTIVTLGAIVQEILQKHASGINFREWNAGRGIDAHMTDAGFQVTAVLDPSTGLVAGGNRHNCGTWMDKMGESTAHGTDGTPATPRDGADVEIVGLSYSVVSWLQRLHDSDPEAFPSPGVTLPDGRVYSWGDWSDTLHSSFERCFYVPMSPEEDPLFGVDSKLVGQRGIYRDTHGSAAVWPDYQLRPNYLIAMAVAPALFTPARAQTALAAAERQLLGERQLGVKTLDPSDWAYRPHYDNASDSDAATGRGFNYHCGPEWLWPYGYYLRARMSFPPPRLAAPAPGPHGAPAWATPAAARRWVFARLARQRAHMESSPDMGLPELTNADGAFCRDSCWSQAWSSATLLDALFDLHALLQAAGNALQLADEA